MAADSSTPLRNTPRPTLAQPAPNPAPNPFFQTPLGPRPDEAEEPPTELNVTTGPNT